MQRLPNPGTEPGIFLRIYCDNYSVLKDRDSFTLDDITSAMIAKRNVTSQGAVGAEALKRSTRENRSLDPLYNQSKMYAELYRTLGWIHSVSGALNFRFTLLGEYLAGAKNPESLCRESLLGIAYPNEVLDIRSDHRVRVFATILKALAQLRSLSRDEIMAGPMSISNDQDSNEVKRMLGDLANYRKVPGKLDKVLDALAAKLEIKRKPSMENYTRFPMAFMPWSGWATKPKPGILAVTKSGVETAEAFARGTDLRLSDFARLPQPAKAAAIRVGFATMLARAGIENLSSTILRDTDIPLLTKSGIDGGNLFFSPFQQLSRDTIFAHCPELVKTTTERSLGEDKQAKWFVTATGPRISDRADLHASAGAASPSLTRNIAKRPELVNALEDSKGDLNKAADILCTKYKNANQDVFYPLVTDLLLVIGLDCRLSRRGVNAQRADAIIVDSASSIPIEIKSPGEEVEISVKAVRQALENKIVLLSRKGFPTNREVTSLVVGFNLPNPRAEVHELIEDIFKTYDIRIGLLDIRTLFYLACYATKNSRKIDFKNLTSLKGAAELKFEK